MSSVTASGVIARKMTHKQRPRIFSVVEHVGYSVRSVISSLRVIHSKVAIAILIRTGGPWPAFFAGSNVYLRPKALSVLRRKYWKPKINLIHVSETYPFRFVVGSRGVNSASWAVL